jgi:hypothetical protein
VRTWAKQVATHGKLLKWSGILDVGESGLELLELRVKLLLGLLGLLNLFEKMIQQESLTQGPAGLTALASKVSIALIVAVTSYDTGLKSLSSFSDSSTIALFFRTER